MPKRRKFRVCLAGPISGCNVAQMRGWRDLLKNEHARDFEFIDPTDQLLDVLASPYALVEAARHAIEEADGLLVNMWRESIGTAFGLIQAHRAGRPVVVADPNHLNSRMLAFYADAVVETPRKAASVLKDILSAEGIWLVVKHRGRSEESFERRELVGSLRAAYPDRGRRTWKGKAAARDAVYRNRRRIRGARGQRLLRLRGERLERPFAHLYETGRLRRVHLRGHDNIRKRLLVHAAALNLGLLMRRVVGAGTPRSLQAASRRFRPRSSTSYATSGGSCRPPGSQIHQIGPSTLPAQVVTSTDR